VAPSGAVTRAGGTFVVVLVLVLVLALPGCGTRTPSATTGAASVAPAPAAADALLAPAAFDGYVDRAQRSRALFVEAARVLTSARCVNCHPADETPRQGDGHAIHDPPVDRGAADRGVAAMLCTGCHQDHNVALARVPGAPGWRLAPVTMAWLGHSPGEICAQIKDRARNGGRTLDQIADHIAHDPLVAWGWSPGADRIAVPGSQLGLAALVHAWIDTGAECPPTAATLDRSSP
jgi:hypothetical protein